MLTKINNWWYTHTDKIATFATLIAMVELFMLVMALMGLAAWDAYLHDLEVQLTAHGVDWALYTPIP